MISKASSKFVRITPRKVRYVIDLIRRKSVPEAQAILNGSPRRASDIIRKLLDQAVDAAQKNSQVSAQNLIISKVLADGGPSMKRFRAASMGRASVIRKRTSHIQLELDVLNKNVVVGGQPIKEKAPLLGFKFKGAKTKTANKKMAGAK